MSEQLTFTLPLIEKVVDGTVVPMRAIDGYVNATAMCQAVGKKLGHYLEARATGEFLDALVSDIGIPISGLVLIKKGGRPLEQGTWVHPDIAINLGQWCSPKFAVAVARWVREWMTGTVPKAQLPYHLERYMANRAAIPPTHWSMLNEMTFLLIAPLEQNGYRLPESMVPDISEGRMFCKWLRDVKGVDTDALQKYIHTYQDGRSVEAKLYPNSVLEDFRKHFHTVWLQGKALEYFGKKDPKALQHLTIMIEDSKAAFIAIE